MDESRQDIGAWSPPPRPVSHAAAPSVEVYEINGPFFFGAAEKFKQTLGEVSRRPKVLVIRMRNVPAIDSTAMHALEVLVRRTRSEGTHVSAERRPLPAAHRAGTFRTAGRDRRGQLFGDADEALAAARRRLQPASA